MSLKKILKSYKIFIYKKPNNKSKEIKNKKEIIKYWLNL